MSNRKVIVLDNAEALYKRAAEEIVHISGEAICTHGQFTLCLTGGRTPEETYRLMATKFALSVDWKEVQFYWGDERCVPPDDPASNFGMANRAMLAYLTLKPEQIHRIRGEDAPERAAAEYEQDLRDSFSLEAGEYPRFDLMLLGLGENAHIASLFPNHAALRSEGLAVAVEVEAAQQHRVTLTAPVINNSARVIFIVGGEGKAQAVKNVLEGERNPQLYPAQIVAPSDGEALWLLDKTAASLLSDTAYSSS